jgi:hypothetical protein
VIAKVANLLGFQLGWFASILGAAKGLTWLGPAVVGVLAIIDVARAKRRSRVAGMLVGTAAMGYAMDSLVVAAGAMGFPSHARLGAPSTLWMAAMWVNLAIALLGSLAGVLGRWVIAAVFGLIGGPLSYWAGERLGAVTLGEPLWRSLSIVGVEWLIAMPLLVLLVLGRADGAPRKHSEELPS